MRKLFLDNLPKKGSLIKWTDSIGYKVPFLYDEIQGEIEIINYENKYITIKWKDKQTKMFIGNFKKIKLYEFLDLRTKEYKYNVNDHILDSKRNILILKQIKIKKGKYTEKGYEYKCLNDNYVGRVSECHLVHGANCPVCLNQKVIKGVNDIGTTHPHLSSYFVKKEDIFKYSFCSSKKVLMKCPNCGYEKYMVISHLSYQSFSCPQCGDGISYPEKFIFNMLKQLKVTFQTEYSPSWVKPKKYDFYIPDLKCIIETHGIQHYEETFSLCGGRTLKEEQTNDRLKEKLAKNNGIENYIILDCRKSELKFIKNNIFNSKLKELFNLSNIDWLICEKATTASKIKIVSDLYNKGFTKEKIIKSLKLSKSTIYKYLKKAKTLNWIL